ncbi:MAG: SpoIIE family protein phosphatase [Desulfobacterales bacterium]|jgi:sigma-B regulation protein RsbU (phosphoserine phosphatase)
MIQPKSLQQRLSIFLILPVALLLIVMGLLGFIFARDLFLSQWREAAILKLQRAAHQVDMRLARTKNWILIFNQAAGGQDNIMPQFWAIEQMKKQESVNHVHLTWNDNQLPPAGQSDDQIPPMGHMAAGRYQKMASRHPIMRRFHSGRIREITPPRYDDSVNHETVSLISELNDATGQSIGRLEVVLDFDVLIKNIRESGWWQSNEAYLVSDDGKILTSTATDQPGSLDDSDELLKLETIEAMKAKSYGTILGKGHPPKEVSGFYKLQEAPWSLVMIAPGKEILSPIVRFRSYYFAIGVGFILLIVVLIRVVSGRTVAAIKGVSEAAERVANGDYGKPLPVETRDEVGELTSSFNSMVRQLKERMQMKAAMNLAMEVQQSLLPQKMPEVDKLDIAARSVYCDETGGDFYDFLEICCQDSNQIGIAVGDVSGHGIPSALLMATVRGFLKSRVTQPGSIAEIITDVNRLATRDTGETGQFLTLFYAVVNPDEKAIRWVRAGHDPALFYDPVLDRFNEFDGDGMAIGLDGKFEYQENSFAGLNKGQILLIGTDGLWETQNMTGEMFGKERLRAVIRREANTSSEKILQSINDALKKFRGERKQEDDITLVVIKVTD